MTALPEAEYTECGHTDKVCIILQGARHTNISSLKFSLQTLQLCQVTDVGIDSYLHCLGCTCKSFMQNACPFCIRS